MFVYEGLEVPTSTIIFYENGTCSLSGILSGTWEEKAGKLNLDIPSEDLRGTCDYVFSDNGKTLTLTNVDNGEPFTYHKQ